MNVFVAVFPQMTAEAVLRLVSDPVLPFYPLDIALDVQNKLKGNIGGSINVGDDFSNYILKTWFKKTATEIAGVSLYQLANCLCL